MNCHSRLSEIRSRPNSAALAQRSIKASDIRIILVAMFPFVAALHHPEAVVLSFLTRRANPQTKIWAIRTQNTDRANKPLAAAFAA